MPKPLLLCALRRVDSVVDQQLGEESCLDCLEQCPVLVLSRGGEMGHPSLWVGAALVYSLDLGRLVEVCGSVDVQDASELLKQKLWDVVSPKMDGVALLNVRLLLATKLQGGAPEQ
jgi:hypothetical protein